MQKGRWTPLNYRSLHLALEASDGKKDKLLRIWNQFAAREKKSMIETILSDYEDVQDKATDAISDPSESDVFAKTKTNREKLKAKFGGLKI